MDFSTKVLGIKKCLKFETEGQKSFNGSFKYFSNFTYYSTMKDKHDESPESISPDISTTTVNDDMSSATPITIEGRINYLKYFFFLSNLASFLLYGRD